MTDGTNESKAYRLCVAMKLAEPPFSLWGALRVLFRRPGSVAWHHHTRRGTVVSIRGGRR